MGICNFIFWGQCVICETPEIREGHCRFLPLKATTEIWTDAFWLLFKFNFPEVIPSQKLSSREVENEIFILGDHVPNLKSFCLKYRKCLWYDNNIIHNTTILLPVIKFYIYKKKTFKKSVITLKIGEIIWYVYDSWFSSFITIWAF